ncbi:AraC family transcriptional regulator [Brachybacterium sp. YJGR34]|uniref:helix-turn-helix domain-containing protein n=1 Tax=Brachybacterium sp. YJGR34 TaxID=2059911 RepID=UPI000E0B3E1B|nr:AraC family transcriptional regulator [Brachybacterium sp. YJGR34]
MSTVSASPAPLDLTSPPQVQNVGRSTHGVRSGEDVFRLPELWSLHLYAYEAELEVDGVLHVVTPGTVSLVPPACLIRYRYRGPSTHLYAHLRGDPVPPGSSAPGGRLEVLMRPGAELPAITDLMTSALAAAATRPARTRADLWTALLRLDDRPCSSDARPARDHVAAAMSYIESRLPEPVTIPEVAAHVGISANHLARVVGAELGETPVAYIRRRRIDHARRLLTGSTMSIPAIAASVGFSDLQAFNKACRAVTGSSPRVLRSSGG